MTIDQVRYKEGERQMTAKTSRGRIEPANAHGADSRPPDTPEQWGWHHEWGRAARLAGWIVAGLLLSMHATVQYGVAGRVWITTLALTIIAILGWDAHRRRNAWRNDPVAIKD